MNERAIDRLCSASRSLARRVSAKRRSSTRRSHAAMRQLAIGQLVSCRALTECGNYGTRQVRGVLQPCHNSTPATQPSLCSRSRTLAPLSRCNVSGTRAQLPRRTPHADVALRRRCLSSRHSRATCTAATWPHATRCTRRTRARLVRATSQCRPSRRPADGHSLHTSVSDSSDTRTTATRTTTTFFLALTPTP